MTVICTQQKRREHTTMKNIYHLRNEFKLQDYNTEITLEDF